MNPCPAGRPGCTATRVARPGQARRGDQVVDYTRHYWQCSECRDPLTGAPLEVADADLAAHNASAAAVAWRARFGEELPVRAAPGRRAQQHRHSLRGGPDGQRCRRRLLARRGASARFLGGPQCVAVVGDQGCGSRAGDLADSDFVGGRRFRSNDEVSVAERRAPWAPCEVLAGIGGERDLGGLHVHEQRRI